jgi:nucleoredoxin
MAFLGKRLLSKSGEILPSSLDFSKPFLIYFSASWCPPCRSFTPKLSDFYTSHIKLNKGLEVVLAGLDDSESAFKAYYDKMPWLSIPFGEKILLDSLSTKYRIATIPTLVLVNKEGEVLNSDCRNKVENSPDSAYSIFLKLLQEDAKKNN